jgi:hypothetical protein
MMPAVAVEQLQPFSRAGWSKFGLVSVAGASRITWGFIVPVEAGFGISTEIGCGVGVPPYGQGSVVPDMVKKPCRAGSMTDSKRRRRIRRAVDEALDES